MPAPTGTKHTGIVRLGAASWSLVGVIALALLIAAGVSALSSIIVPLVIAVILGTVLEPAVTWLEQRRVPKNLAVTLVLLGALGLAVGMSVAVIQGFIQQLPEISRQLTNGWTVLLDWLRTLNLNPDWIEQTRLAAADALAMLGRGAFGAVTGALYSSILLSVSAFFALYFLFFVLRDGRLFPRWLARVTAQNEALITEVDAEVRESIRGYFSGTALTAIITGPIFVLPLLILKIPLIIPTIVLYFFLSFVPYVGAWITGVFAILIAFGYGGTSAALIVGAFLLISNGPIQNVVLSWALGSSLKIHPVMVLIATVAGGVVAGVLGMVLGPPLASAVQKSLAAVRRFHSAPELTVSGHDAPHTHTTD